MNYKKWGLLILLVFAGNVQGVEMQKLKVPVDGYEVMTYSYGKSDNVLLLISGGPGLPSNFFQFRDYHAMYADHDFRVVTWDQLGCGESDMPDDDSLWTIERFVHETEAVRQALQLANVHILGHSWGGVIGLEYAFAYPGMVQSFILVCCATSVPEVQKACDMLKMALGKEIVAMMEQREVEGTTDHPEYQAVVQQFLNTHTCRMKIWPHADGQSANNINPKVREKISGSQFLKWTGPLKDWDRLSDLDQLAMPILIIQGEYDWVTPEISGMAYDRLSNAHLKILKDCSHLPYYEDPKNYEKAVIEFLEKSARD